MARVVVVGAGVSGLAAAALLEEHQIDYTLIEVKRRVGGSLITQSVDGFLLDGAGFTSDIGLLHHPLMKAWGLQDSLQEGTSNVFFRRGVQSLVDALSARVSGPRLMRMALSSIGDLEDGALALCLENGLMLNARAIILALPARYAERVFYGYRSEITEHLLTYQYESRLRISLGYRRDEIAPVSSFAEHPDIVIQTAARLPERGGALVQWQMRTPRTSMTDEEVRKICIDWEYPVPDAIFTHHWAEADPLTPTTPEYPVWRDTLMAMLPPRVALIGSDYVAAPALVGTTPLSQCLTQAQDAVNKILGAL